MLWIPYILHNSWFVWWSGRSRGVELTNNDDPSEPRVLSKDYERDKDDQGIFLLSSTGQIENCTEHLSVLYGRYLSQSATIKLMHVFLVEGWWVTIDFDSKYKISCGNS